jgi:hypothetical protein
MRPTTRPAPSTCRRCLPPAPPPARARPRPGHQRVDDVGAVLEDRPRDARRRCGDLARVLRLGGTSGNAGDPRLAVDQVIQLRDQRLLRADAVVHGLGRHSGSLRDLAHAGTRVPPFGEQMPRGSQDLVPQRRPRTTPPSPPPSSRSWSRRGTSPTEPPSGPSSPTRVTSSASVASTTAAPPRSREATRGSSTRSTPTAPSAINSSWRVSSPPGSSWPSRARPSMCRVGR